MASEYYDNTHSGLGGDGPLRAPLLTRDVAIDDWADFKPLALNCSVNSEYS